jgi:predicted transposase YbfD/YdcC
MARSKKEKLSLIEHFSIIPDPRLNRKKKYKLIDIIVISVCGMISGCNTFVDIAHYGESKQEWFKQFLELPNGIPSHDTFGRVLSLLNPLELQNAFYDWTQTLTTLEGEIINIDGKYLNASHGASNNKRSIFGMVNAWASKAGIALAQLRTDYEKKGEKAAFKDIIDFLELKGALVTMDANGAHADITNRIIDKDADFLIALKKNQRSLYSNAERLLNNAQEEELSCSETKNKGHGRIEMRKCIAMELPKTFLQELEKKNKKRHQVPWKGLKSVCKVVSNRSVKGKATEEIRYYLTSLEADSLRILEAARSHWGVENKLHWTLDVSFDEDSCRIRNGFAGENMAVIRQLALNLLKQEKSTNKSVNSKRLTCGWENDYLKKVITGMTFDNIIKS